MRMETMKKVCVRLLFGIVLCLTLSLGFSSMQAEAAPKLNKKKVTLTVGKTAKLKVKGTKKKVKWSSSKKSVCTVNKSGTIKGIKKGTATIKAKVAKKTLKCKVTVKAKTASKPKPTPTPTPTPTPVEPTAITVMGSYSKLAPGGTMQLTAVFTPANATGKIKWYSSYNSRATVSANGLVTAGNTGEVTITAELESNRRVKGTYTFNVEKLTVDGEVTTADGGDLLLSEESSRANYTYSVSYLVPDVQTQVLDAIGNEVRTYPMGSLGPGKDGFVSWDLKDRNGNKVSPGRYCFQVVAAGTAIKSSYITVYANSEFGSGNGSENSPYLVSSLELLQKVSGHNGAHFRQTEDIDVGRQPFMSLFTTDVPFTGTYDGNGHTIKNIISTKGSENNIAIFRAVGAKGTIQNLVIDNCTFNGNTNVSAIVGINEGNISNCVVKECALVAGNGMAGGIAAENRGVIQDCRTEHNNVSANKGDVGGICAQNTGAVISCSSTRDIIGLMVSSWADKSAGGMAGYSEGNVIDCKITSLTLNGTKDGYGYTHGGGSVGYNKGTVSSCNISDLTVEGDWNDKGGVIGVNKAINDNNTYDGSGALDQVGSN